MKGHLCLSTHFFALRRIVGDDNCDFRKLAIVLVHYEEHNVVAWVLSALLDIIFFSWVSRIVQYYNHAGVIVACSSWYF